MKKINIFILFVLCFYLFKLSVNAKVVEAVECEYTDAYTNWLLLPDDKRLNVLEPPKCKSKKIIGGRSGGLTFSSSYDIRNYNFDSGRKYQDLSNSCWAFASIAGVESNLLVNNRGLHDFSEAHLELATQDSLFNSIMPFKREFSNFGFAYDSIAYFFNRVGPVLETQVPFQIELDTINGVRNARLSDISSYSANVSVNSVMDYFDNYGSCGSSIISTIKHYVASKGSLAARIIWDYNNYKDDQEEYYYNSSYDDIGGHFVSIIGWDDNMPASNFKSKDGDVPSRNGAWLVKNSNNSFDGYNYISYDDVSVCTELYGFYDVELGTNDNVYYYDQLGINDGISFDSDNVYLANKYSKKSSGVEKLTKVAIPGFETGVTFDIYFSESGNLSQMQKIYSGMVSNMGYNSYDISDINIVNDNFAIAVKYNSSYVEFYNKSDDSSSRFSKFSVEPGHSFISFDGNSWSDFKDNSSYYYASIKAYTDNIEQTENEFIASFSSDNGIESIDNVSISCTTSTDSCSITLPNVRLKNGYRFLGWYTSINNGSLVGDVGSEYIISSNVTLYGISEAINTTYTADFKYDTGVSNISNNSLSCTTSGDSCNIILPNINAKSGYEVLGWYTALVGGNKVGDVGDSYSISNDITLFAVTKKVNVNIEDDNPVMYTVTFDSAPNLTVSDNKLTCTYSNGECIIVLPNIDVSSEYSILGWYTAKSGGQKVGDPGDVYSINGNITLYPRIISNADLDGDIDNNVELIVNKNPNNIDYEDNDIISSNPSTNELNIPLIILILVICSITFIIIRNRIKY